MKSQCEPTQAKHIICPAAKEEKSSGEKLEDLKSSKFEQCFETFMDTPLYQNLFLGNSIGNLFSEYCNSTNASIPTYCYGFSKVAKHIVNGGRHFHFFACTVNGNVGTDGKLLHQVCDGVFDCDNKVDESSCPGMYTCEGNASHVIQTSKLCDNNKDCPSGDDECQNCAEDGEEGSVSSDGYMVGDTVLSSLIVFDCVTILLLNAIALYDIQKKNCTTKAGQIDRRIRLLTCFYDGLMGIYMMTIFIKSRMFSGSYCTHDFEWRSSNLCKVLGTLFTFSAHGSLLTISTMSCIRCS